MPYLNSKGNVLSQYISRQEFSRTTSKMIFSGIFQWFLGASSIVLMILTTASTLLTRYSVKSLTRLSFDLSFQKSLPAWDHLVKMTGPSQTILIGSLRLLAKLLLTRLIHLLMNAILIFRHLCLILQFPQWLINSILRTWIVMKSPRLSGQCQLISHLGLTTIFVDNNLLTCSQR